MNNTILCRVVTELNQYDTERYFTFNNSGTSGTDYTLSIKPTTRQAALINKNADIIPLELKASFYDYSNKELSNENAPIITWEWMEGAPSKGLAIIDNQKGNNYREISGTLSFLEPKQCLYNVLQCSVRWNKITQDENDGSDILSDQPLTLKTYYPLPFSTGDYYIDGATTIIYDDLGKNPSFNKNAYKIYNLNTDTEITDVTWEICYYNKQGILWFTTA